MITKNSTPASSIALCLCFFVLLPCCAAAARKKTVMLTASCNPPEKMTSQNVDSGKSWMDSPVASIEKAFFEYSSIGGTELTTAVPKNLLKVFSKESGSFSWQSDCYPEKRFFTQAGMIGKEV